MFTSEYEYFTVSPGASAYRDYLALRHDVFCKELQRVPSPGWLAEDSSLETDVYDAHSIHVLCTARDTGAAAGCGRLILPGAHGLNVSARYRLHCPPVPSHQIGEIGRLGIAPALRRYRGKTGGAGGSEWNGAVKRTRGSRRDEPFVALGLYRELFRSAERHGITHCYAAMEPSLARLLNRIGFPFEAAGQLNPQVYPPRRPYFIGAHAIRRVLADRDSCLFRFIFGDLANAFEKVLKDVTDCETPATEQVGEPCLG